MDVIELARRLIAIESVNPIHGDAREVVECEAGVTDFLVDFLDSHQIACHRQEVTATRHNVIARIDGRGDPRVLVLDAHQDTVGVEGMTVDPFGGAVRDGRLYGRGACDVKGGMAAILRALVAIRETAQTRYPTVIATFTCDEEHQQIGAQRLVQSWLDGTCDFLPEQRPDLVIVNEPTGLDLVVAHKGVVRWTVTTCGVKAHSSKPELGVNAIYQMADVIQAAAGVARRLQADGVAHPLCGGPSLSVGTIRGGTSVNVVPDECHIEIDRRLAPGEDAGCAMEEVAGAIAAEAGHPVTFSEPWCLSAPLESSVDEPMVQRLRASVAKTQGDCQLVGVGYGTHAPRFAELGPTVVMGPGSIDQAHTVDEWIDVQQLFAAEKVLSDWVLNG